MSIPKRILYVHSGDDWIAGSERVLLDIVESLDSSRYQSFALCTSAVLCQELVARGVKVQTFPLSTLLPYGGKSFSAYLRSVTKILSVIREWKIDFVHATSALANQYVLPASRYKRIPVIAHVQGTHLKSSRIGALICHADAVVAVSNWVSRDYSSAGDKLTVIINGIDTKYFSRDLCDRERVRRELGLSLDDCVVGTVGQLIARKRPQLFIEIASLVIAHFPTARFIMAGGGPLDKEIATAVRAAGLSEYVHLVGYRPDIPALLSAMDVFIFTSQAEALGLAPLEASSSGLPVVAGYSTALPEVVEDEKTGFLVDPDDVGAYAERCLQLLKDEPLAQRMGDAGREMILRKFSLEAFRMNIDQLYRRLLRAE